MSERGNIIKTMHRELAREGVVRGAADLAIYDPTSRHERELVGRLMGHGLSNELNDRHYLIVDGVDGRAHYVDIGRADADPPAVGGIIAIEAKLTEPRAVANLASR
jgi:type IV secretory pathway VirD2 relaxase